MAEYEKKVREILNPAVSSIPLPPGRLPALAEAAQGLPETADPPRISRIQNVCITPAGRKGSYSWDLES